MSKNNALEMNLPSVDDLFGVGEEITEAPEGVVVDIPLNLIDDFPNHPFKVRDDEYMFRLVSSVKDNGVLSPGLIRRKEDGRYEMVAGHRRKKASKLAHKTSMPCIIRQLTDSEAAILMVDSNIQREYILPSERAFAYKIKMVAIKQQGKRNDLTPENENDSTSGKNRPKLDAREKIAKDAGERNYKRVSQFIRLTELIPEMLQLVDDDKIALNPGEQLSYLDDDLQAELFDEIKLTGSTPSFSQAVRLKKAAEAGTLDRNGIALVLSEEKPQQREFIKLKPQKLSKYFSKDATPRQMEEHIFKALDYYAKHRNRIRQQEAR